MFLALKIIVNIVNKTMVISNGKITKKKIFRKLTREIITFILNTPSL